MSILQILKVDCRSRSEF